MKNLFIFFSFVFFFIPYGLNAQLKIDADIRNRSEFRAGYRIPINAAVNPSFFISQRTRFLFEYKKEKLSVKTSFQDVRIWGDEIQGVDIPAIGLHEAFAQLQVGKYSFIKVGRQELIYDDHRLLGNSDWNMAGRSHDALLYKFKSEDYIIDIGGAYNQLSESYFKTLYTSANYQTLVLVRAEKLVKQTSISIIYIGDAYQINDSSFITNWRNTAGPSIVFTGNKLEATGRVFFQMTENIDALQQFGYMVNTKIKIKFDKINVWGGYDHLSGDNSEKANDACFNTLYATNHKFYGTMDYYLAIPKDTYGKGLKDFYAGAQYICGPKSSFQIDLHQFFIASPISEGDPAPETINENLGVETDLQFSYAIMNDVKLTVGQSIYFPTATTGFIKSVERQKTSYWTFVLLAVSPQLFQSK